MSKRFTDSEKWKDPWFHKLSLTSKLLFLYLCDQCDIAGFWEIDLGRAAFDIGCTTKSLVTAMEPLRSRYETNGIHLWIRKFIQFQGNYPFKPNVAAHKGIMKLLSDRKGFSEDIPRMLEGKELRNSYGRVTEGLFNPPSKGQGKGQGKGNGKSKDLTAELSYTTSKGKILKGKKLKQFEEFLDAFGSRAGKASAADSWIKIDITDDLFAEIIAGAKRYALLRASIIQRGNTPKMAQGWLTTRRWEDEIEIGSLSESDKARAFTQKILAEGPEKNGN